MKRLLLATTIAATCIGVAQAKDADEVGAGTITCADFSSAYSVEPNIISKFYFSWAQGFMTAANFAMTVNGEQTVNLSALPIGAQIKMLRIYCEKHPLEKYMMAVEKLYESLPKLEKADTHDY